MSGLDYDAIQLAVRNAALAVTVATTGSTSLSATALGFARSVGSFITDGFAPGMEVSGTGFNANNNAPRTITQVTAGFITAPGCTVQTATAGRTLTVGMPSTRGWENVKITAPTTTYVEEQFIPGPVQKVTLGLNGELELTPMYSLLIHVPDDTGIKANGGYAKALLALFSPGTTVAVGSEFLRVRSDVGPFRGQRQPSRSGFSVVPVTIPFRMRTTQAVNTL
jgi:uncharacterized protein DUF4128